jgi:hypothetical protein
MHTRSQNVEEEAVAVTEAVDEATETEEEDDRVNSVLTNSRQPVRQTSTLKSLLRLPSTASRLTHCSKRQLGALQRGM